MPPIGVVSDVADLDALEDPLVYEPASERAQILGEGGRRVEEHSIANAGK